MLLLKMAEAIVEFDYIAQEDDELTLRVGDVITNITKTSDGWCEGVLNGRRGMFPDNFIKEIKKENKESKTAMPARRHNAGAVSEIRSKLSSVIIPGGPPPPIAMKKPPKRAKVTFAYTPQQDDELALEVGSVIEILKQDEPNWWEGSLNGKVGMFPSNFVEIFNPSEGEKSVSEEVPEIRGRKVEGVGFGNIFGGGPIVLRSKVDKKDSIDTSKEKTPTDAKVTQVKLKPSVPTPTPSQPAKSNAKPVRARVLFPYTAVNDDELDLGEGDIIIVLDQNLEDDGWWKGEFNGKIGVFPDNFVELMPIETEKPQKPSIPPPPSVNNAAGFKTASAAVPGMTVDPQKAKIIKKEEPKSQPGTGRPQYTPSTDSSKPLESKPNLETDDHKAKKNRTGTLDSIKPNEASLTHPTAFRAKPPVRRPQGGFPHNRETPVSDDKPAAKVQPQVPYIQKDDHLSAAPSKQQKDIQRDVTHDSAQGGNITREQFVELQHEVGQLRETVEQIKRSQEKRLLELMAEVDEEKKIRLNLQVEIERLKKIVASD